MGPGCAATHRRPCDFVSAGRAAGADQARCARASRTERSPYWLGRPRERRHPDLQPQGQAAWLVSDALGTSIHSRQRSSKSSSWTMDRRTARKRRSRSDAEALRRPVSTEQEAPGPGVARNRGIDEGCWRNRPLHRRRCDRRRTAAREHLLAHASRPGSRHRHPRSPRLAGRACGATPVMDYVCGDAALQFAYTLIPRLPALDHRFFYTSNISLKRAVPRRAPPMPASASIPRSGTPRSRTRSSRPADAARARDPATLETARAVHDHRMDLDGFAARERRAGEMAVVFHRKHPGEDDQAAGAADVGAARAVTRAGNRRHASAATRSVRRRNRGIGVASRAGAVAGAIGGQLRRAVQSNCRPSHRESRAQQRPPRDLRRRAYARQSSGMVRRSAQDVAAIRAAELAATVQQDGVFRIADVTAVPLPGDSPVDASAASREDASLGGQFVRRALLTVRRASPGSSASAGRGPARAQNRLRSVRPATHGSSGIAACAIAFARTCPRSLGPVRRARATFDGVTDCNRAL